LPERRSRNVILQLVVDHNRSEVEEVAFGPGFIERPRRDQTESGRMDRIFQPSHAFFVGANEQNRHELSVSGAIVVVNDKRDYSSSALHPAPIDY